MATKNAILSKVQDLTIDSDASTNSQLKFKISTAKFNVDVNQSNDTFRIDSLQSSVAFVMTSDGERTMPNQPTFLATLSSQQDNVTGDGTLYTVICNTEIIDRNADYNTSTGTFTAPVTGRYFLSFVTNVDGGTNITSGLTTISTSNRDYSNGYARTASSFRYSYECSVFVDMDASDTANSKVSTSGDGSATSDVKTSNTIFSGYLVC